ncbi:MAG: nitrile hydratase accessory protein [Rhodobacteraceae bacterium]|nr:nitrile hydratase accessory protein [Paracoccaceae bacterium]
MTVSMTDRAPDPVFSEPWHGQVFALTVHLHDKGLFSWPRWTDRFGAVLARHGLSKELDGGEDYFAAWLETLEAMLAEEGAASGAEVDRMRAAWEKAYLSTPHGHPVHLA